jgi:hypothetical protein
VVTGPTAPPSEIQVYRHRGCTLIHHRVADVRQCPRASGWFSLDDVEVLIYTLADCQHKQQHVVAGEVMCTSCQRHLRPATRVDLDELEVR